MARGWESKSVESQQESAVAARRAPTSDDPQVQARTHARGDLELSRTRIMRELGAATHPRHREQLETTLRFLDDKIAELDRVKAN